MGVVIDCPGTCGCGHGFCRSIWAWSQMQGHSDVVIVFERACGLVIVSVRMCGGDTCFLCIWAWSLFLQEDVGVVAVTVRMSVSGFFKRM